MPWVDALTGVMVIAGAALCVVGGIGILRMPEFFTRTHATGVSDTLGAGLILIGLAFREGVAWGIGEGSLDVTLKLLLLLAFIYVVSPTGAHALARAAHAAGLPLPPLPKGAERDDSV